jgi:ATP-dependent DNA ligase
VTDDVKEAVKWFHMGTGLDGIVAKRKDLPYQSGERSGMQKIKKQRTADCVVGGFRYLEKKPLIGSLLLGLFNDNGLLDHVGFTSSIHDDERSALTKKVEGLIKPPGFTGKAPGGPSRWSTKHSSEWEPLETRLVVEVQFDHFTGGRFRPRNEVSALAPRQGSSGLHHEASTARESLCARVAVGCEIESP